MLYKYFHKYDSHDNFNTNKPEDLPNISFDCDMEHVHYDTPKLIQSISVDHKGFISRENSIQFPNNHDYNYLELEKIYGNTLVWNQLCGYNKNTEISANTYYKVITTLTTYYNDSTIPINHKIYISCYVKISTDYENTSTAPRLCLAQSANLYGGSLYFTIIKDGQWHYNSGIVTNTNNANYQIDVVCGKPPSSGTPNITGTVLIKSINVIDLTLMYGVGYEPTLEEFESAFPLDYYSPVKPFFLNTKDIIFYSKDENDNILGTYNINTKYITGKLNGTGDSITIFPDGLRGCYSANECDQIIKEDGKWVAYKYIDEDSDLSNNSVSRNNTDKYWMLSVPNKANGSNNGSNAVLSTKYATQKIDNYPDTGQNRTINPTWYQSGAVMNIKDDRYTDADTLKSNIVSSKMSIYYKLKDSMVNKYILDDNWQNEFNKHLKCSENGTIYENITENTFLVPLSTPLRITTNYLSRQIEHYKDYNILDIIYIEFTDTNGNLLTTTYLTNNSITITEIEINILNDTDQSIKIYRYNNPTIFCYTINKEYIYENFKYQISIMWQESTGLLAKLGVYIIIDNKLYQYDSQQNTHLNKDGISIFNNNIIKMSI